MKEITDSSSFLELGVVVTTSASEDPGRSWIVVEIQFSTETSAFIPIVLYAPNLIIHYQESWNINRPKIRVQGRLVVVFIQIKRAQIVEVMSTAGWAQSMGRRMNAVRARGSVRLTTAACQSTKSLVLVRRYHQLKKAAETNFFVCIISIVYYNIYLYT